MPHRRRKDRSGRTTKTSTNVYICKEHYMKQTHFCRTHNKLVCDKCLPTYHRRCDVCEITSAVQSVKPSLLELKRAVSLMEHRCEHAVDNFRDDFQKALIEIDDMECRIINMFSLMKRKLRLSGNENMDMMKKQREKVKEMSKELSFIETGEKKNDVAFVLKKVNDIRLIEQRLSALGHENTVVKLTVKFRREIVDILKDENKPDGIGTVSVQHKSEGVNIKALSLELEKTKRVSKYSADYSIGKPQYVGLACLSKGRVVALDDHNRVCNVMNLSLQTLGTYDFEYSPVGVAAVSETEFAVTFGVEYLVDILALNDQNKVMLKQRLSATSCYDSVCLISEDRLAITTFADRRPVRIMIKDGDENDDVIKVTRKSLQLGGATVAFSPLLDMLVFADRFENTVNFYNIPDRTMHSVADTSIDGPRGICVIPNGFVLVCSQNNHSIVEISPSGKIVGIHKVNMKYPRAICVTSDGTKIVVSNGITHSGRVQVYNLR